MNIFDFNDPKLVQIQNPLTAFAEEIAAAGFPVPPDIAGDGKLRRFDIKKKNDAAGWYVLFLDGHVPAGSFGSWQTGEKFNWCAKSKSDMSDVDREYFRRQLEKAREQREAEQQRLHERARKRSEKVWAKATDASPDHPYLIDKGVKAHGIKQAGERLIVPFLDVFDGVQSLQWIEPSGKKKFEFGGAIRGNFFTIPGNESEVIIAEGYSTAATVHEATGSTVVVAFNAGNLLPVAKNIRSKYTNTPITIAADNDQFTNDNPGITKANEAAAEIGARVVYPEFKDLSTKPTDFNDLARLEGLDAVKKVLRATGLNLSEWSADIVFQGEAPERIYLIEQTLPLGSVMILAAMGDAGKGMLTLDLGLSVASTTPAGNLLNQSDAFGHLVRENGSVVIFTAEDDRDEVHRRINGIANAPGFDRFETIGKRLMVIPLPNAGGPFSLVSPGSQGPEFTHAYSAIRQQLLNIKDLKLVVFDPLASFCSADINADPAVGAYMTGLLSSLATETGAAIIVCHHVGKGFAAKPVRTAEQARNLIRGTSAIVDGVRSAYVLWPEERSRAKRICNVLKTDIEPNKVFSGALVKSNGPGDRAIKTYVRQENGLLKNMSETISQVKLKHDETIQILKDEIAAAAEEGHPFTLSGASGIYERSDELFESVRYGRDKLQSTVKQMLEDEIIIRAIAKGSSTPKWLDVPDGPFATGRGVFEMGARIK